ncbi:MAG: carbonate dehydratase [Fimbriimonadales bacterium]
MAEIRPLLENNNAWASRMTADDPAFFERLVGQQSPKFLWIGCSDSRVPANEIVGLAPGELFVHRNVANLVIHTDFNCLSVIEFAIEHLKVEHVIVCGHYDCGGIQAALRNDQLGLIDNWLQHIKDIYKTHERRFAGLATQGRSDLLSELNVVEQVFNVCRTTMCQRAWTRGQPLSVHGWIYRLNNGLLNDLNVSISSQTDLEPLYRMAVSR